MLTFFQGTFDVCSPFFQGTFVCKYIKIPCMEEVFNMKIYFIEEYFVVKIPSIR